MNIVVVMMNTLIVVMMLMATSFFFNSIPHAWCLTSFNIFCDFSWYRSWVLEKLRNFPRKHIWKHQEEVVLGIWILLLRPLVRIKKLTQLWKTQKSSESKETFVLQSYRNLVSLAKIDWHWFGVRQWFLKSLVMKNSCPISSQASTLDNYNLCNLLA